MPTLRQKVDVFCKDAGAKVDTSDKLRTQVKALKTSIQTMKADHKKALKAANAAKTQKVKAAPKAKTQRKREKVVPKAPKAPKAPKIKQEVGMNPLPAQTEPMMAAPAAPPSLAPAAKGARRRHYRMRW